MGKYQAEEICIASIYYGKVEPVKMYHGLSPNPKNGRCTLYELEPVKRGAKPFVLTVADAFERVPNPIKSEGNKLAYDEAPVDVNRIVDNLISIWAGNMIGVPPGASPGIMRIIGTVPQKRELDDMMRIQTAFAEHMFNEGEKLARASAFHHITDTMRESAVWLNYSRNWINVKVSANMVDCQWCKQPVPEDAFVCHLCSNRLIDGQGNRVNPAAVLAAAQQPQKAQPVAG